MARAPILSSLLLLAVVACGGSDDAVDSASGDVDGTTATDGSATTSTTLAADPTTTTAVPTEPATTAPPATTVPVTTTAPPATTVPVTTGPPIAADCLVGTWELRAEEFLAEISEIVGDEAAGATLEHYGGRYYVELRADGSYEGRREAFQIRASLPEGAIVVTIDSVDPGTYDVEGDTITVSDPGSEATISVALDQGGVLVPMPAQSTFTPGTDAVSGSGTYTCGDDLLTIALTSEGLDGFEVSFDRA